MVAVAALLERRPALLAMRRTLPRDGVRFLTARSPAGLDGLLTRHLIDAVVIGSESLRSPVFEALRRDFTAIPVFLYSPLRSDDAGLLRLIARQGVAGVLIEGIDEGIAARMVSRQGLNGRRRSLLQDFGPQLDLTDPIQVAAWNALLSETPISLTTTALAKQLGVTRETLSRRFAAGRAPALKDAITAVRLIAASELLACSRYTVADVARLLGYTSAAMLQRTARRLVGRSARSLSTLSPQTVLASLQPLRGPVWG
jgi:AraC-like DNA-binding protein